MVPTVYQRFINAVNALTVELREGGPNSSPGSGSSQGSGSGPCSEAEMVEVWQPFIAEALALPAQHR